MDPDEDPFVASRVSLQSRRERLAKRNEQSTQETQRFFPSDDNHNAETSLLPDAYSAAADGSCPSAGRVRRPSETKQSTNSSTCRDREYVQPKIVDHCDVVALSLIQSSSILSMEEQSSHARCSRSLSGEGSMSPLRRTMPAKMRASFSSDRGLLDNSNIADSSAGRFLRRTSVDCTSSVPAANGGAGESNLLSSATNGKLRRQSSFGNEAAGSAANGQFGWMPGNSTLTSGPVHAAEAEESGYGDAKRPLESTPSEESREERIARYKEQRRRSKQVHSFISGTNDEREISGSATKQWHSLEDADQQQQQQPLLRGSGVFFDPRHLSSSDAVRSNSVSSSISDSTASDLSAVGVSSRRRDSVLPSADGSSASSPPLRKPELTQPGVPPDVPERAAAAATEIVTPQAALSPLSPSSASHRQYSQSAGISDAQVSEPNGVASASTTNPRRNSARRRRSNLLADVEQADAAPVLLEVPAEAESGDAGAESVSVVTRPRRRRATAEKSEGAESGGAREITRDSGSQALWQQWQQLTSPRGAASPSSTEAAAAPAPEASSPEKSTGKSCSTAATSSSAERGSAALSEPHGVGAAKADRRRQASSGDAPDLPSDAAAQVAKLSAARSASTATARRAEEDELRSSCAASVAQPATPVASTSTPAALLGSDDLRRAATVVESTSSRTCDNQAAETETKANPSDCNLPVATAAAAVPPGTDTSGVGSATALAQNKKRAEKKNAALGLILQKFEAASSVLPPALAAAIGLPSPTSSSADSSQPKPTPLVKTGKVESTIKQMAAGQQPAEPPGVTHATEKAATHAAHPAASVGSLVRKFAGAASPPTSLHLSLLSSTDGSDAVTTVSKSSASPVRPASPAAGTTGDAAGGTRLSQQRADGGGSSSSSRPPSPKVGGWPPVGTGVRSGHSSPGSARRSPVSAASPAAFMPTNNVTDSDASSQLTDDGQHSDVASGRRHAGVPAMKQHLQSPEKLQSQQAPYYTAVGKKPPKAGSTPVAPSVTSAEAADEPARDSRLTLAVGRHDEGFGIQCDANAVVLSLEPTETEVRTDADGRELLPREEGTLRMQKEAINSVHEASSAGLTSPESEQAAAAAAVTMAAGEATADDQHRSSTGDHRSSSAQQQQQQSQTFAKLRAAPPPPSTKPSASAKSEPSQPLLDPQLATILQARLKKVESKGHAAAAAARPSGNAGSQVHDEQQHGKSAGRDDAVDRSAHSIKDRAQYFMQMQQKALGAADASPPVGARPAGQGVVTRQPSTSTEHARNDSVLGVHSRPAAAHHTEAGRQEPSTDLRPSQPGYPDAVSAAAATADDAVQQAEGSQQKSSRKERRRDRRRRGSLHGGKECDRWQTQPVTDSEVLVAAAVVVRGQPGSVVLTADCLVQQDGSGLQASAAAGFASVAGAIAAQPSGVGAGDDVDEVRRLAVMTLEEKIGLFMDRSVAWSNCTDADAAALSPDRSIRRLPNGGEVATSRRYRRCAWQGRFSTQPVSPAELHRAIRVLGSSALGPPTELGAELNAKIERLCFQLAERQHADKQSAGAVVNQRHDKAGRSVVRRSAGGVKKASGAADPVVSHHLNGSNESHAQHARTKTETGRRAVSGAQRKGAARPTSLIADPQSSSSLHTEQNGGSPEKYRTDAEGISRGSALRQSQHAPPAMRSKTSDKPAKARPVSMNLDLSMHAVTHGAASPVADPARGTASAKPAVSRQRPHSAKAAVTTQGRVRKDDATKSNGAAAGPSCSDARRASTSKDDEKKEKISPPENTPSDGAERTGAAHEVSPNSEQLTWADKSKSQPCISTMDDDGADDDLPSYMRATSSYARKVEHLLMESDDEDESSNAHYAPDGDKSSLDASRHDHGSRNAFQRATANVDGASTRASIRRPLGSRMSVGAPLESPTSGHSSDVPSYMRATKAVSMRDIRSPAAKPSPSADEPTSSAVGVRTKRRSVDGSRNSLPPPPRPASVTTADQSVSGDSDGGDNDDDDDELPSYMRATKSFARKVEHLIESCDEDDENAVAATRRDECSDAGDRASSARRSPAPRRSRTPSTHGGSDLTPSEPYALPTRDSSKQLDSDGGNDRSQKHKPHRSATSRNASSTSLHVDGPAAHQEHLPELSSPGALHGPSSGRTSEVVAPIVDGRKRKTKAPETLTQSAVLAEVNGNHKVEAVTAPGKSQHQSKDKHTLLGGDLPSFMRATKSSTTKDRHRPASMTLPEHPASDVAKSTKGPLAESTGKQHVKGQGSRESLCSTGANSTRAESGHHSSSESAEHTHVAPIPLLPMSNCHTTTTASKSRKSSSSRTSTNMGVAPRHTKQPIGATGGAVG